MNKVTKHSCIASLALVLGLGMSINSVAQDSTKVFFSEYIEGSSNNKALEIYNATGVEIDLSKVVVKKGSNGGTFEAATDVSTLQLEGTLAAGEVYVIANSASDATILAVADTTFPYADLPGHQVVTFNGDDAVGLFYNGALVDIIGDTPGTDPGTNWTVAGTGATSDFTLVRKAGKTANAVALSSFGTNADDSEWIVYPQNTFEYLGTHTFEANSNEVSVTFTINMATLADTISAVDKVVINGSVKGPRGSDTFLDGETLGWDANATAVMTNVGGDYWKATYRLAKGDTLLYKYRYILADGSKDQDEQGILVPNAQNPKGWDTRFVIATEDVELDVDYWQVEETANGIESGIPFITGKQDTVALFFRVNVGAAFQAGEFDPETDSVGVRGTPEIFGNPGDWSATVH